MVQYSNLRTATLRGIFAGVYIVSSRCAISVHGLGRSGPPRLDNGMAPGIISTATIEVVLDILKKYMTP